jgi:hypothetical protein
MRSIGISVNVNGAVWSLLAEYLRRRGDPEFPNTWQGSDEFRYVKEWVLDVAEYEVSKEEKDPFRTRGGGEVPKGSRLWTSLEVSSIDSLRWCD